MSGEAVGTSLICQTALVASPGIAVMVYVTLLGATAAKVKLAG